MTKHYTPISETEYLRVEAQSPIRHEYVSGEMFAMTGGTLRHNVIAGNLYSALRSHLRNTKCRPFMTDVRVRVARPSAYYYPDVLVSCPKSTTGDELRSTTAEDPKLIVEVLSESTASTDTREKLLAYRTLPSVAEYVLISQDEARVEIHRRSGDIGWEKIEYTGAEIVHLASVDLMISMRDIYDGVPIESLERGPGES